MLCLKLRKVAFFVLFHPLLPQVLSAAKLEDQAPGGESGHII